MTQTNSTEEKVLSLMEKAAAAAHDAMGRYKFERFGYHASQWVMLNKVLDRPRPSPFRKLVRCARQTDGDTAPQTNGTLYAHNTGSATITMIHQTTHAGVLTFDDWMSAIENDEEDDVWTYLDSPGSEYHARTNLGLTAFTFRYSLGEAGAIIAHGTCHPATETDAGSLFTNRQQTLAQAWFEIAPHSEDDRLRATAAITLALTASASADDPGQLITYHIQVPPRRVEALAQAATQAGLKFDPRDNMVETGPAPDDAVHLTGDAAPELAHEINGFLRDRGWTPRLRAAAADWPVQDIHRLLQFAASNLVWEGDSIAEIAGVSSQPEWTALAAEVPGIFYHSA